MKYLVILSLLFLAGCFSNYDESEPIKYPPLEYRKNKDKDNIDTPLVVIPDVVHDSFADYFPIYDVSDRFALEVSREEETVFLEPRDDSRDRELLASAILDRQIIEELLSREYSQILYPGELSNLGEEEQGEAPEFQAWDRISVSEISRPRSQSINTSELSLSHRNSNIDNLPENIQPNIIFNVNRRRLEAIGENWVHDNSFVVSEEIASNSALHLSGLHRSEASSERLEAMLNQSDVVSEYIEEEVIEDEVNNQ